MDARNGQASGEVLNLNDTLAMNTLTLRTCLHVLFISLCLSSISSPVLAVASTRIDADLTAIPAPLHCISPASSTRRDSGTLTTASTFVATQHLTCICHDAGIQEARTEYSSMHDSLAAHAPPSTTPSTQSNAISLHAQTTPAPCVPHCTLSLRSPTPRFPSLCSQRPSVRRTAYHRVDQAFTSPRVGYSGSRNRW